MNKSDVVREAARGNWLSILSGLCPNLSSAVNDIPFHVPCPNGTGESDGFRLFKNADETGGGISNIDGAFPDGFSLLMWSCDWTFSEAMNEVAIFLDIVDWKAKERVTPKIINKPAKVKKTDEKTLLNRRFKLRKLWTQSYPINHPESKMAKRYFTNRSIFISSDDYENVLNKTMRFHKSVEYWHRYKEIENGVSTMKFSYIGSYPAIINLVSFDDGTAASLHITYLNEKGSKLDIEFKGKKIPSKKIMSSCQDKPLTGGSIQYKRPQTNSLHLSEGVETALAVFSSINEPVWPCVSSTLLGQFNPPQGVDVLNVWSDLDRSNAGYNAALKLRERMKLVNVKVNIFMPPQKLEDEKSIDWNDILVLLGKSYFHEALLAA